MTPLRTKNIRTQNRISHSNAAILEHLQSVFHAIEQCARISFNRRFIKLEINADPADKVVLSNLNSTVVRMLNDFFTRLRRYIAKLDTKKAISADLGSKEGETQIHLLTNYDS